MSEMQVATMAGTMLVLLAYWVGLFVGRVRHSVLVARHLQRVIDYQRAIDDLDQ